MNEQINMPPCDPLSDKEAGIFRKALTTTKFIVEAYTIKGCPVYKMNDLQKIKFRDQDDESAIATGLHLLLCNQMLLFVK